MVAPSVCRTTLSVSSQGTRISCLKLINTHNSIPVLRCCRSLQTWSRKQPTAPRVPSSPFAQSKPLDTTTSITLRLRQSVRHESTTATQSTATTQTPVQGELTWNDFLQLRRRRRYINLGASVGTAVGSVAVAVPILAQYEVDQSIAQITGMDPFIGIGLAITVVGGFGWLMGPFVGNAVFGLWKRNLRGEIARREKDFYAHVKRFRADPASSSVNNPVPDYYGEKIGSVADYRRWLKDQRAFNRKKNKNLI